MKKNKKNWIIVGLCLSLCAAVYMNWVFNNKSDKVLGESIFVNSSKAQENKDYFINARLERKSAMDEAVATLNSIVNNANSTTDSKNKANEGLIKIAKQNEQQVRIESLVLAKGYKDCLAMVGDDYVTVIIDIDALKADDVVKIKDVAIKETGFAAGKIQVMEAKSNIAANATLSSVTASKAESEAVSSTDTSSKAVSSAVSSKASAQ